MATVTVKRQNVILKVDSEDTQHYLNLGYQVIDDKGNVIMDNNPDYKALYFEQLKKVEELEAKISKLTAKTEKTEEPTEAAPKKRATRKSKTE